MPSAGRLIDGSRSSEARNVRAPHHPVTSGIGVSFPCAPLARTFFLLYSDPPRSGPVSGRSRPGELATEPVDWSITGWRGIGFRTSKRFEPVPGVLDDTARRAAARRPVRRPEPDSDGYDIHPSPPTLIEKEDVAATDHKVRNVE